MVPDLLFDVTAWSTGAGSLDAHSQFARHRTEGVVRASDLIALHRLTEQS
jgi:hypothetical protein